MSAIGNFRKALGIVVLIVAVSYGLAVGIGGSIVLENRVLAQQDSGTVPGAVQGNISDSEIWRAVRGGVTGNVSIPDKQAGVLIQSEGENWRAIRNGPLSEYGIWGMLGIIVLLALFFAIRGRIKVESGFSGRTIERFNGVERFAHWLMAGSFVILALTGLNILYGRYVLPQVIGAEAFAAITYWGKLAHNYLAFAFMLGILMAFVLWVAHNLPSKYDFKWVLRGGGMFSKGSHPPAKKFNAGQKVIFWIVVLGGLSISLSGLALMFPFETQMFAGTFKLLNAIGFDLPTALTPMEEQQLAQVWHGAVGLLLIVVILAHIYIGTVGMQGAFAAMGSGKVDENWAREHHSVWVAEVKNEPIPDDDHHHGADAGEQPASSGGRAPQNA